MADLPSATALDAAPEGALVAVPVLPEQKATRASIEGAGIVVDPTTGTLTWWGDTPRDRRSGPHSAWLPRAGADPAQTVSSVVTATYVVGNRATGLTMGALLFVAADGSLLFRSHGWFAAQHDAMWPPAVLQPLSAAGVSIGSESFSSVTALAQAHPGAAGGQLAIAYGRGRVLLFVAVILLIGGLAALITLL